MGYLILVRHGQSTYNQQNRFTGSFDAPLTDHGKQQAIHAGRICRDILIHHCHCSALSRAQETENILLSQLKQPKHEIISSSISPALNERDYGDLTGLNKKDASNTFGDEQVLQWRRGFSNSPPNGESLLDTKARVVNYHETFIRPQMQQDLNVLVVAHGNSLRALVGHLLGFNPQQFSCIEVAWCTPWVLTHRESQIEQLSMRKNPLVEGRNRVPLSDSLMSTDEHILSLETA